MSAVGGFCLNDWLRTLFTEYKAKPGDAFKIDLVEGYLFATMHREDGTTIEVFRIVDRNWNVIEPVNPKHMDKEERADLILKLNRLNVPQMRISAAVKMSQSSISNIIRNRGINTGK